jgi:uncharacterized membrane protein (Fun14 family)
MALSLLLMGSSVSSVVDKVKDKWEHFDLQQWATDIGGSSAEAVQAAVYFGLSLAIGFLFKKYFKFVFACLIVSALMIKVLEMNHLLEIDWTAIKTMIGMNGGAPSGDFNATLNHFFDWIKNHLLLFISTSVGFLVGYKLG